jgi:hypothetical protein
VHLFALDNQERVLDLDNDLVLFLVADLSRPEMELHAPVAQVVVITAALRSEVEVLLVAHAPVAQVVQVAQVHAVAVPVKRAAHSVAAEKVARPIANRNLERLVVKRSIIYAHLLLVALSFHVVMAQQ